jgi:hypothetical protein
MLGLQKTRAGKCKAAATLVPQKIRKAVTKKVTGIKINDPAPKAPSALTPPNCIRGGFTMHRSNM